MLDTYWQDIRFGLRLLWKNPGFAGAAVLCLALGIGPNTTMFSLVNAVLLRPLDVREPSRLVEYHVREGDRMHVYLSYPQYVMIEGRGASLAQVGVTSNAYFSVQLPDRTEVTKGSRVSSNFFDILGRSAKLGNTFRAGEPEKNESKPPVVLSHGFWHDDLHGDAGIVGNSLKINGRDFTVVGIMPDTFTGIRVGFQPAFWIPANLAPGTGPDPPLRQEQHAQTWWTFGRLTPGSSIEALNQELQALATPKRSFSASALNTLPADQRQTVYLVTSLVMAVVGLVLLIACASVAALLLARSVARRREIAIRLALGASRGRLIRQLLTESVLLTVLAGGAALFLTFWTLDVLAALLPSAKPMYLALPLRVDYRVLAFTSLISLLSGVIVGLVPALQASRPDLIPALKDQVRVTGFDFRSSRLRNGLVVVQTTLAVLLLIVAGLFVKDLRHATTAELGFDADKLLVFSTNLSLYGYSPEQALEISAALTERLRRLPGIESVAVARHPPLSPRSETNTPIAALRKDGRLQPGERTLVNAVGPDYFRTVGIPILKGRPLEGGDAPDAAAEALVNQALTDKLWPGENPIGQRFSGGLPDTFTVIGVVGNSSYRLPGETVRPQVYVSFARAYRLLTHAKGMVFLLRTQGDPESFIVRVRHEIGAFDSALAASDLSPLDDERKLALWPMRTASFLFGSFGVLAMVLAMTGVYGVVSHTVHLRRFEIAIRMALGARPVGLVLLFLRQGLVLVLGGAALGVLLALGCTPVLRSLLSGTSSFDLETLIGVPLLLTAVAALAIYLPARHAARVDPMVVLRYE